MLTGITSLYGDSSDFTPSLETHHRMGFIDSATARVHNFRESNNPSSHTWGVPGILNRTPGQVVYTLDRNQHGHMQQLVPHQKAHSPEIDINPHKASRSHPQAWQHPHMESTYFYNGPGRLTEIHYLMNERKIPLDKIHEVYPSIGNWMDFYVSLRGSKEEKVQKILSDLGIGLWGVRNAGTEDMQEWLKAVYIGAMPDQKYPGTNAIRLSINATMNDTGITPVFVHSNHGLLLMSLPPQLQ